MKRVKLTRSGSRQDFRSAPNEILDEFRYSLNRTRRGSRQDFRSAPNEILDEFRYGLKRTRRGSRQDFRSAWFSWTVSKLLTSSATDCLTRDVQC